MVVRSFNQPNAFVTHNKRVRCSYRSLAGTGCTDFTVWCVRWLVSSGWLAAWLAGDGGWWWYNTQRKANEAKQQVLKSKSDELSRAENAVNALRTTQGLLLRFINSPLLESYNKLSCLPTDVNELVQHFESTKEDYKSHPAANTSTSGSSPGKPRGAIDLKERIESYEKKDTVFHNQNKRPLANNTKCGLCNVCTTTTTHHPPPPPRVNKCITLSVTVSLSLSAAHSRHVWCFVFGV